jgi:hypothetical protein
MQVAEKIGLERVNGKDKKMHGALTSLDVVPSLPYCGTGDFWNLS